MWFECAILPSYLYRRRFTVGSLLCSFFLFAFISAVFNLQFSTETQIDGCDSSACLAVITWHLRGNQITLLNGLTLENLQVTRTEGLKGRAEIYAVYMRCVRFTLENMLRCILFIRGLRLHGQSRLERAGGKCARLLI